MKRPHFLKLNQPIMRALYNITGSLREVLSAIEDADGEVTPAQEAALAITQQELTEKGINYALFIKELDRSVDSIDAEISRLEALKRKPANLSARLKNNLAKAMIEFGVEKIDGDLIRISFRKSEQTVIDNENDLPAECINEKVVRSVDRAKVKELIKSGKPVAGAHIAEIKNLQIK